MRNSAYFLIASYAALVGGCATPQPASYGTIVMEIDLAQLEEAANVEPGSQLTLGLLADDSTYQTRNLAFDATYGSLTCAWVPGGRYSIVYLDHATFADRIYPIEATQFFGVHKGKMNYAGVWKFMSCRVGGRGQVCVRISYPEDWQQRAAACAQNDVPVEVRRTGPTVPE